MNTITHDTDILTQLLPVVIAVLFFSAGWLGAANRWRHRLFEAQRKGER